MELNTQKQERIIQYDIIRTIACLMVVMMHSPMPSDNANGLFLSSLSYLTAPSIGLFFMISGALLLPTKNTSTFIKKRFSKIIIPTLFWSLFYMLVSSIGKSFNASLFLQQLLSIPFSPQGNGVLWFMYTLMGLYLVSPVISKWIEHSSENEIRFYLIVWGVSLCYPLLESSLILSMSNNSVIYYFSGYLGYYLLGYYLKKYPESLKTKWVVLACVLALAAPVACKVLQLKVDFYSLFWYLSIFVVSLCLGWFKLIGKTCHWLVNDRIKTFIILFSNLSLGIYLIHIFVMRTVLWNLDFIISINNYVLQTLVVILLTASISFVLCLLISFIPKSEYIIGFHYKK